MRLIPDDTWATLTIWIEARGESFDGQTGVGEVIRERMTQRYSSDGTVAGTVLHPYQFSGWNSNDINRRLAAVLDLDDPVVISCLSAWHRSHATHLTDHALFYYAPSSKLITPSWVQNCVHTITIGKHHFFRLRPIAVGKAHGTPSSSK